MRGRRTAVVVVLVLIVLAVGVGAFLTGRADRLKIASHVVRTPDVVASPLHWHSVSGLPDPICTPGATDPRVAQSNIHTTICVSGYSATVRPSSSYTDALKVQQIQQYGYADTNLADYEEDHLIPLELGGHPTDPKNLWPEPRTGNETATKKSGVENSLHNKVCAGLMTLAAAQALIATNWESA